MSVLDPQLMREEKMKQLEQGHTVYAESPEFIRMMKRGIQKAELKVDYEEVNGGCYFIPVKNNTQKMTHN